MQLLHSRSTVHPFHIAMHQTCDHSLPPIWIPNHCAGFSALHAGCAWNTVGTKRGGSRLTRLSQVHGTSHCRSAAPKKLKNAPLDAKSGVYPTYKGVLTRWDRRCKAFLTVLRLSNPRSLVITASVVGSPRVDSQFPLHISVFPAPFPICGVTWLAWTNQASKGNASH